MEYVGILDKIDAEEVGESWIQALIRLFNFPDSPDLFLFLKSLNDTFRELDRQDGSHDCGCSLPPLYDVWWWTRYSSIDDVKVAVINSVSSTFSLHPSHHEIRWAKRGVLFINNYVNPKCSREEGHKAWETITCALLQYMANNNPHLIFVIHGNASQKYQQFQKNHSNVLELQTMTESASVLSVPEDANSSHRPISVTSHDIEDVCLTELLESSWNVGGQEAEAEDLN